VIAAFLFFVGASLRCLEILYQSFTPGLNVFQLGQSEFGQASVAKSSTVSLRDVLRGRTTMSIDMPVAFEHEAANTAAETHLRPGAQPGAWTETALTVLFAAATVLFASFVAVVTGIV
jgi:hypothetical protein